MNGKSVVLALLVVYLVSLSSAATAYVVYVKGDSQGQTLDGSSWTTAFHTIAAGLNAAASGDDVWVGRGTYSERITLKSGVRLYGGFAGYECQLDQRDWKRNVTTLDAGGSGTAVTAPSGATTSTVIDGFTITHGLGSGSGGGLHCYYSSPMVRNNTFTDNAADGFLVNQGGAIYCGQSSAVIENNIISGNRAGSPYYSGSGGGVYLWLDYVQLRGNTVVNNSVSAYVGTGGGVYCSNSSATITNNTISDNSAQGVYVNGSGVALSNNVVTFNGEGIRGSGTPSPTLRNNCVYGNTSYDYVGLTPGTGDIWSDPVFADRSAADYHLRYGSPCINAGFTGANGLPALDRDGDARTNPYYLNGGVAAVDIGSDEYYRVIHVKTSGNDEANGLTWDTAKRTLQAAIDAGIDLGEKEVWVASGEYAQDGEVLLDGAIYGGFDGTEVRREERDPGVNETVIRRTDGPSCVGSPAVIGIVQYSTAVVDGFTIKGGGCGIGSSYPSTAYIRNNTVRDLIGWLACDPPGVWEVAYAVGIQVDYGVVECNRIIENPDTNSQGIRSFTGIRANGTVRNNLIARNRIADVGDEGGYVADGIWANGVVVGNTVVGDDSFLQYDDGASYGISATPTQGNTIRDNIVVGWPIGLYTGADADYSCLYANGLDYYYDLYDPTVPGDHDILSDPQFVDAANGDYHLGSSSPCIDVDAGPSFCGSADFDLDGTFRPVGGAWDMGAFEFLP